jgi:hypothetical protein
MSTPNLMISITFHAPSLAEQRDFIDKVLDKKYDNNSIFMAFSLEPA